MRAWFSSIRVLVALLLFGCCGAGLQVLSYFPFEAWPAIISDELTLMGLDILNFLLGLVWWTGAAFSTLTDPEDHRLMTWCKGAWALLMDPQPAVIIAGIEASSFASCVLLAFVALGSWTTLALMLCFNRQSRVTLVLLFQYVTLVLATTLGPHTPALFKGMQLTLLSPETALPAALIYTLFTLWQTLSTMPGNAGPRYTLQLPNLADRRSRYSGPREQLKRIQDECMLTFFWVIFLLFLWVPLVYAVIVFSFWQVFFILDVVRVLGILLTALLVRYGRGGLWVYAAVRHCRRGLYLAASWVSAVVRYRRR